MNEMNPTRVYTVCNADGIPVSTYDNEAHAREACVDLARECLMAGDDTNGYYVDGTDYGVWCSELKGELA